MQKKEQKESKRAFPATKRVNKALSKEIEQIDLDVTPVMNLLMVLIPFLESIAVFTHLAVVEFSLPPSNTSADDLGKTKELDISIVVTAEVQVVGTQNWIWFQGSQPVSFEHLRSLLKAIKFEYPSQKSVVLVIEADVIYDDIIKFMDICRESQFPDVGLSGDIG